MGNSLWGIDGYVDVCVLLLSGAMVSLILFLASFDPAFTSYGFPSGNSSAAPVDVSATITPVSSEDVVFPPPHCADLWNLSTPNAEETQSSFSLGFVDPQCGMFATPCDAGLSLPARRRVVLVSSSAPLHRWATVAC